MTMFLKTGSRFSIVLSLTAAAMVAPEVSFAGPGCMSNQRMAQGFYPYSPMWPHAVYGQRAPYPFKAAPPQYAGMMPAPYRWPLVAPHSRPGVAANTATSSTNATSTAQSTRGAASSQRTSDGKAVTVRIDGMRFEPASITVEPGTTVTWVHGSRMPHTITGNADGLRSRTLYQGQKFSHTFDETGTYKYACDFHPSMRGSVVVEESGADT